MTDLTSTTIESGASRSPRPRWMRRGVPIGLGLGALVLVAAGCITAANVANDTLTIKGSSGADTIVLRLKAGDPNTLQADDGIDSTDFSFDRSTFSKIVVDGGGGDDTIRIDHSNGVFTDTELTTLLGGDGNDTLTGDVGTETLDGGAGDDVIDGNQGTDTLIGGTGNDTFQWDPGDGSDTIDGGTGTDRLAFNGSNANEQFDVAANGSRVRFTRNVAAITMDLDHLETLDVAMLGGTDGFTVHDLTGTDLTTVTPDLAASGGVDDAQPDEVAVPVGTTVAQDATDGAVTDVTGLGALVRVHGAAPTDRIHVTGTGPTGTVTVAGTPAGDAVNATANGTDVAVFPTFGTTPGTRVDLTSVPTLVVNLGAGDDGFSATGNLAPLTAIQVNGQDGEDTLLGGNGTDVLDGGVGDDFLDGNQGNDTLLGGTGNDTVQWDPGDGSDTIDGGDGVDRLAFNGSNIGELFDVSGSGSHVLFTRNVAAITMDLVHLETLDVAALGGADVLTVHDLTGTDLTSVNPDFSAFGGVGDDGAADEVAVPVGTTVQQDPTDGAVTDVTGLGALVRVHNAAPTDRIHVIGTAPTGAETIVGTAAADAVNATANGTDVSVFPTFGTTPDTRVDLTAVPTLVVNLGAGDDSFSATGNLAPLTAIQVNGQDGKDTLLGGNGTDVLDGGVGDDFLDGNQGNDTLLGGTGNDTVQWDPGDGSDTIDGGTGTDRLAFNGSNIGEVFDVSASGSHVLFTRNVAAITMDLVHLETLDVAAIGGADVLTVHDLSGTDLTSVNPDFSAFGGVGDDGAADDVAVPSGTTVAQDPTDGTVTDVTGLGALVRVRNAAPTDRIHVIGTAPTGTETIVGTSAADAVNATANGTDVAVFPTFGSTPGTRVDLTSVPTLVVNLGAGDDSFSATGNLAPLTAIQVNGQDGKDTLLGGNGTDVLDGGTGDDLLDGNQGNDTLLGGTGNDTFQWDPGDGSDTLDGGDGVDRLAFNGSNIGEVFDVSANGTHVRLTRNVAAITMDLVHVETLDIAAIGGADVLTVNDLTGTDLTTVNANLAASGGVGDGSADTVIVNGTPGDDVASVGAVGTTVEARGLAAIVRITGSELANDRLTVNGLAGNDTITPTAEAAALILLDLRP